MAAMPRRSLLVEPEFGLGTTDHLVPFQCSIRVRSALPPNSNPAAHTSLLELAATAFSSLLEVPTLGLRTECHEVPSKCSVRVLKAGDDPRNVPTAQTSDEDTVATAVSSLKSLLRFGVRWMVQMLPAAVPAAGWRKRSAEIAPSRAMERWSERATFCIGASEPVWGSMAPAFAGAMEDTNETLARLARLSGWVVP